MTFSFQPVFWSTLLLGWIIACLKTHRGPLVLLAGLLTHTRASLLCARRAIVHLFWWWRVEYQFALEEIKESK
jgi:hypothetical protein